MTVAEVGAVICREGVYKIPTVLLTSSSFVCGTVLDILAFNLPALAISALFFFFCKLFIRVSFVSLTAFSFIYSSLNTQKRRMISCSQSYNAVVASRGKMNPIRQRGVARIPSPSTPRCSVTFRNQV